MTDVNASRDDTHGGQYTRRFEELGNDAIDLVGGKNASLGEITAAGVPVPPGFAVTTVFYRTFMEENELWDFIEGELAEVDPDDTDTATEASQAIRERIESEPIPEEAEESLEEAWRDLEERTSLEELTSAVRSSATAEDLPDASFAGQQDTYLNVTGLETLKEKVLQCISSLFTTRAITYREENDFDHDDVEISVGVQRLVKAKSAGVMFTINPQNGDRSKVQIEGNWGLGETVVSGSVNPDNFLVDKAVFEIVDRNVSEKAIKTEIVEDGVEETEVDPQMQSQSCLTEDEIFKLTEYGKEIEEHYGDPQDIEWVIDEDLDFPENVFIVQSRPETVWSQKEGGRDISKEGEDAMDMMMDSLSKTW